MKWGDVQDHGEEPEELLASPSQTTFCTVGEDGIKTITEFTVDENEKKIKIVRKVKETRIIKRVPKAVLARRKWAKFGDAYGKPPGPEDNVTIIDIKIHKLDLKPGDLADRHLEEDDNISKQLEGKTSIVVCRFCGAEGHFSLKCPNRDKLTGKGVDDGPSATTQSATGEVEKWVPIHRRNGGTAAAGTSMGAGGRAGEREDYSIRVTNISEDTTDDDLRELFRRFGHTTRIYLAKDYQTGNSRGFAFVSYVSESDAQKAIDALNGHGYDNLILHVDWARERGGGGAATQSAGSRGAGKAGWTMRGTK